MKLKYPDNVYLEKYDVYIKPYLTCEEVMNCAKAVMLGKDYIEREANLNAMLIKYCLIDASIENVDADLIYASGLMESIRWQISNLEDVDNYVHYEESYKVQLTNLLKQVIEVFPKLEENVDIDKLIEQYKELVKK